MKKTLNFEEFERNTDNKKYSKSNIQRLFKALSNMDKESRKWYLRFYFTGAYPAAEVEGFTVETLIKDFHYTNAQAFLVFDWLKHNPEEAKFFMYQAPAAVDTVGEKTVNEMREYLIKKGIDPDAPLDVPKSINEE